MAYDPVAVMDSITDQPEIETWRPVVGWEGLYSVSDRGRVRSEPRTTTRRGRPMVVKGRILTLRQSGNDRNRPTVALCRDGRCYNRLVHRLVLEAYRGPCPEGQEACHYNDDPSDNRLENLRWDTPSANTFDKVRNGRHHQARKTRCKNGHEFTPENTYVFRGSRNCRTCQRGREQARRTRK